jgi:hypothetical protein
MKTWLRRAVVCQVVLLALAAAAQTQRNAVAFTVSMPSPGTHIYHITAQCPDFQGETVEFRLPVWTPGYYGVAIHPSGKMMMFSCWIFLVVWHYIRVYSSFTELDEPIFILRCQGVIAGEYEA